MFIPIEFQKAFQKTEQTALAITATYTDNPIVTGSRFGGQAYWQDGVVMPTDSNGRALTLLVQINFAELPRHADLPDKGILQFFMPTDDEHYGANLQEVGGEDQLVVKFWQAPEVDKAVMSSVDIDENTLVPVFGAHSLTFQTQTDCANIDTIECAEILNANPFEVLEDVALNEKEEQLFFDAITEYTASYGHKLLGYPNFINSDPRENGDYRLLLQIDTDREGDNDIMWGDNGIGQLFIRNTDLLARRFDRVWLYWDY